jgi:tRNA (cytidine/uridine-2'-O-)-methyltransferase
MTSGLQPIVPELSIVLVSPQIPPNTGNVARLCAVTGCKLFLIEPLGFSISDRELKRAGLDYWDKVFVRLFKDYGEYAEAFPDARRTLFSARAEKPLYDVAFEPGHHLVFGSETQGLPDSVWAQPRGDMATLPMLPQRRSLNLSTAVGIATYEAIRQIRFARPM